jgi:cyclase
MTRLLAPRRAFGPLLAVALALPAGAQEEGVASAHVQGAVHMITGNGGNIGVLAGDDGLLMIDDKFAPLAGAIREELGRIGDGPLMFLLNTHHHGDHTGGNAHFGVDTPILAHHNVRARLQGPDAEPAALPVVTFDDGLSVHINGEHVEVVHYPAAHTDGDAVIHFHGSNVVHTGDILFHRLLPYVDIDSGGSIDGVIAALEDILSRTDEETVFIAGHGVPATQDDLRTHLRMLRESLQVVQAGIDAGHSLEELQAAGVGEEWADWSWGFISTERWVATVHRTLTQ